MSNAPIALERLQTYHNRAAFDCGKDALNRYLQQQARQNATRNTGVTYVAVASPGSPIILGFYTLLVRTIPHDILPAPAARRLPPGKIGVTLLARLAVDKTAQSQGIGRILLLNAMRQVHRAAQDMGIYALVLDAIDDDARNWYLLLQYGFEELLDDPRHLFVPVAVIEKLGVGSSAAPTQEV